MKQDKDKDKDKGADGVTQKVEWLGEFLRLWWLMIRT